MRVLIVEDEVRLAETLRDLLELERYTADICHDGESGLDNALSDIYDLVILDVMLPKKDGFSVLRALRQAGKTVPNLFSDSSRYTVTPSLIPKGQTPPIPCPIRSFTSSGFSILAFAPKKDLYL